MSDLMSLLSLGSAGLAAQNAGVAVASNNVANANTDGYSRERIDLQSISHLGGVKSGDAARFADALLGMRIRTSSASLSMSKAGATALGEIQDAVSGNGTTVDEQLGTLLAEVNKAAASPTDRSLREQVVSDTRELVNNFRRRSAAIDQQTQDSNNRLSDSAAQATVLAKQLANANLQIKKNPSDDTLKDQRDKLANQLAQLVGGTARIDGDGQMRYVLDGGAVLVDGTHPSTVSTFVDPATGFANVLITDGSTRRDVTRQISGGSMGADLNLGQTTLAGAKKNLDQLAYQVALQFNAIHSTHAGADGLSGRNMFTPLASATDAAKTIAIDPGLDADPNQLALAAVGAGAGDNTGALALYGLATATNTNGGTLVNSAIDMGNQIGVATANATADAKRDQIVADHLDGLRDSISGVDTQEELTNLSKFQNASSAMTKFISTIDTMLGDFIDKV